MCGDGRSAQVSRHATNVAPPLDVRETESVIDAGHCPDLDAVGQDRITHTGSIGKLDDAQRFRGIGTTAVHPFHELLSRVAPLGEVHSEVRHAGRCRNCCSRVDLGTHSRPAGGDSGGLVALRRLVHLGLDERDVGLHPNLESIDSGSQTLAEAGIGVENECFLVGSANSGKRIDFAGRVEHEGPSSAANSQITNLLCDLGLQVGERIGPRHGDRVTSIRVDQVGGQVNSVIGVHTCSLAWHTAFTMSRQNDSNDDGPISPDGVSAGHGGDDDDFGLDDLDRLARRAVDSVLHLVRRANALAGGVLIFVVLFAVGGFLLGLSALSGGIRTVWIVLGGFFAVVAIGSVVVAMLRLRSVKTSANTLVTEVRSLVGGDGASKRTVSDTVDSTENRSDDGIVDLSREFMSMRGAIGDRAGQFASLTSAVTAVTSFPGLMAIATLIGFVFAGLSAIFAIALVL